MSPEDMARIKAKMHSIAKCDHCGALYEVRDVRGKLDLCFTHRQLKPAIDRFGGRAHLTDGVRRRLANDKTIRVGKNG